MMNFKRFFLIGIVVLALMSGTASVQSSSEDIVGIFSHTDAGGWIPNADTTFTLKTSEQEDVSLTIAVPATAGILELKEKLDRPSINAVIRITLLGPEGTSTLCPPCRPQAVGYIDGMSGQLVFEPRVNMPSEALLFAPESLLEGTLTIDNNMIEAVTGLETARMQVHLTSENRDTELAMSVTYYGLTLSGIIPLNLPSPQVLSVGIDIKPGSAPNCFNNDGHGAIPVAIFGNPDFDATHVDLSTVQLDGQAIRVVGRSNTAQARVEDLDGDGHDDLVVQIEDVDGTYVSGNTIANLTGNLLDGTAFEGIDTICIVP